MQNPLRFTWPLVMAQRRAKPASSVSAPSTLALDVPITAIWPLVVADFATQSLGPKILVLVLMSTPVCLLMLVHGVSSWEQFTQTGSILKLYQGLDLGSTALKVMLVCLGRSALRIGWRWRAIAKTAHTLRSIGPALLMGEMAHAMASLAAALCLAPVLSALCFDAAASWHVWTGFERATTDSWQQIVWHTITALWPQAGLTLHLNGDWAPIWLRLPLGVGLLVISGLTYQMGIPGGRETVHHARLQLQPWLRIKHLIAVWGAVFIVHSLLIEAPIALVTHGLLPQVVRTTGYIAAIPLANMGAALSSLLASAVWLTVITCYECQLAHALLTTARS